MERRRPGQFRDTPTSEIQKDQDSRSDDKHYSQQRSNAGVDPSDHFLEIQSGKSGRLNRRVLENDEETSRVVPIAAARAASYQFAGQMWTNAAKFGRL